MDPFRTSLSRSDVVTFCALEDFAAAAEPRSFDLIVSNPPYIPSCEVPELQVDVRDFEDHGALDGGRLGVTGKIRKVEVTGVGF